MILLISSLSFMFLGILTNEKVFDWLASVSVILTLIYGLLNI